MTKQALAYVPYIVVGLLQMVSKVLVHAPLDRVTRPLLAPLLLLPVLLLNKRVASTSRPLQLLVAGLVFSWLGDITLSSFIVGLGCFLVAHVAYIGMLKTATRGPTSRVAVGAALVWWVALIVVLWPHLGALAVPVAVYGAVLVTMAALATRGGVLVGLGGWLFVLSDSGLAFRTFTPWLKGHVEDIVIMGLYVVAQLLIIVGMIGVLDARGVSPSASR